VKEGARLGRGVGAGVVGVEDVGGNDAVGAGSDGNGVGRSVWVGEGVGGRLGEDDGFGLKVGATVGADDGLLLK